MRRYKLVLSCSKVVEGGYEFVQDCVCMCAHLHACCVYMRMFNSEYHTYCNMVKLSIT